ncbi:hypothetical protein NPIL_672651 [Nephila pilipes]|uniref:Uncharacterized protein n=1 Tax=Nephila pilipes TaxID=299642 RepID=A0A8X6QS27_NEPPI|nr:hypothetical protein NPIL_672651 [Nephila pilipes]
MMHPSIENINVFDIGSLKEKTVKDILTEAKVLHDRISIPMSRVCDNETSAQIRIPFENSVGNGFVRISIDSDT